MNSFDPFKCGIRRIYTVENHRQGFIRAWHCHMRESKWVTVVSGAALVCAVQYNDHAIPWRNVMSASEPSVLHIPAGHGNGFMSLTPDAKLVFFSNQTLDDAADDDIRLPYDHWNCWEIEYR